MRLNPRRCFYFLLLCMVPCDISLGQQVPDQSDSTPDAPRPSTSEPKSFFARWADFYRQDWSGTPTASPTPTPARRGVPSPLDSPPFPNADWSYGGSPVIGEPDTNSYPLMTAINQAQEPNQAVWMD